MNFTTRFKSPIAGLLTTVSVLGLAALLPTSAKAVLLTSSTVLPTMAGTGQDYYFVDPGMNYTSLFYDIGTFTFADAATVPSLVGLQINVSLNGLDTSAPGVDDYGHIDLTLNGIDTGVQMNGFGNGSTPTTITGIVDPTAAAAIYTLFQSGGYNYSLPQVAANNRTIDSNNQDTDPNTGFDTPATTLGQTTAGQLVVGLVLTGDNVSHPYNTDNSPNIFRLAGGTATMEVSDVAIQVPFEPSQAVGFGLIALFIALWYVPATKEMMKRVLVPATV